ncbi:MAG TPA: hypothetical protein VKI19_09040 [Acidimicrobiales bacterium]|nr:hypothetical protein [Acidimicrobiales bacterium]
MTAYSTSVEQEGAFPAADRSANRHEALAAAVAGIRVRRGSRIPVEQILLGAAAILFPLGLIFILLGWEGAAHNGHTYAQIDYLISGGIFGLGLSVAGGFMYFGYWLSRQLGEARRQSAITVQALQRIEELLDASLNSRVATDAAPAAGPAPAGPSRSASGSRSTGAGRSMPRRAAGDGASSRASSSASSGASSKDVTGEMAAANGAVLYATPRGTLLHRAQCPVVAKRDDLRAVHPGAEGYGYCTMCDAAAVTTP